MNKPLHILRYGTHADQTYFGLDFRDGYDVIAVNANMIAFSPDALSTFLGKKTIEKGFFIDPITHAFQHDQTFITNSDGIRIKKSIANLINCYGEGLKKIVATEEKDDKDRPYLAVNRPLIPDDISDTFIQSFTQNVIEFQQDVVKKKEKDYEDYVSYAKDNDQELSDLEIQTEPQFLVAPYFFIEDDGWVEKNIAFVEAARKIVTAPKKLFAQIVLSKKLILKTMKDGYFGSDLEKIIGQYKESDVDGYLIWVDKYREHEEIADSLKVYIEMLTDLKAAGKTVYSLYGSYFSVILCHSEIKILDGVCHGLEYGESRDVVPVGGGLPMPKYYFPILHRRVNFGDMVRVISRLNIKTRQEFFEKICNCSVCEEIIKTDDVLTDFSAYGDAEPSTFKRGKQLVTMNFATTETKSLSLKHYLANKSKEFNELNSKKVEDICTELEDAHKVYKKYIDAEKISYLEEWIEALPKDK